MSLKTVIPFMDNGFFLLTLTIKISNKVVTENKDLMEITFTLYGTRKAMYNLMPALFLVDVLEVNHYHYVECAFRIALDMHCLFCARNTFF